MGLVCNSVGGALLLLAACALSSENTVAAVPDAAFVAKAREAVRAIIKGEPKLAPKMVRLSFHDCVGGCDGCIDLGNPDNWGLEIPIAALERVVEDSSAHMSRADTWALAGSVANEASMAPAYALPFVLDKYGRHDCGPSATGGSQPWHEMPSPNLDIDGVLDYFAEVFDMSPEETVAILGAHTLGYAAKNISGFDGPGGWDSHPLALDNKYYGNLYKHPWRQEFVDNSDQITPDRWIWRLADIPGRAASRSTRAGRSTAVRRRKLQEKSHSRDVIALAQDLTEPTNVHRLAEDPTPKETQFMFNSDIALVWTFDDQVDLGSGKVDCRAALETTPGVCNRSPTANQVLSYAEDASKFYQDYERAFKKMIETLPEGHPPLMPALDT